MYTQRLCLIACLVVSGCGGANTIVPAGSASFGGAWGSSKTDVWFIGADSHGGVVYHWNGSVTAPVPAPAVAEVSPSGIWGSSASDIWISGNTPDRRAALLHYDGTTWTRQFVTDRTGDFGGIWGTGP